MTPITIISGPTCVGKTSYALELAQKIDAEIISCDSVQIYRGMDIGSAKVTSAERVLVPHHLIDVANVDEIFDVAKYVELAKLAFDDIKKRGKNVIVVGGSGFYLKSWFSAVADKIEVSDEIKKFTANIEKEGIEALARELLKVDPNASQLVDMNNPRRTKNALERCLATSKSVKQLREEFEKLPCPMGELERKFILLDRPDDEILQRIKLRTAAMIKDGLIEETRRLIDAGLLKNPSLKNSVGYKQAIEFIESNSSDFTKLENEIVIQTMSLVHKQRKYFKTQLRKPSVLLLRSDFAEIPAPKCCF